MLSEPEEAEGGDTANKRGGLRGRGKEVVSRGRHLEVGRSVRESGGIAVFGVDVTV